MMEYDINIECFTSMDIRLCKAVPSRTTMAKTFDGPPTLERRGSEHRRAVTSSRS